MNRYQEAIRNLSKKYRFEWDDEDMEWLCLLEDLADEKGEEMDDGEGA